VLLNSFNNTHLQVCIIYFVASPHTYLTVREGSPFNVYAFSMFKEVVVDFMKYKFILLPLI